MATNQALDDINWAANQAGVDPVLLAKLIAQESSFDPRAVSGQGAQGLGQLMPETAQDLGVKDPFDPRQNLEGSARYLAQMLKATGGDVDQALTAYHSGLGNVQRGTLGPRGLEYAGLVNARSIDEIPTSWPVQAAGLGQDGAISQPGPALGEIFSNSPVMTSQPMGSAGLLASTARNAVHALPQAASPFADIPQAAPEPVSRPGDGAFGSGIALGFDPSVEQATPWLKPEPQTNQPQSGAQAAAATARPAALAARQEVVGNDEKWRVLSEGFLPGDLNEPMPAQPPHEFLRPEPPSPSAPGPESTSYTGRYGEEASRMAAGGSPYTLDGPPARGSLVERGDGSAPPSSDFEGYQQQPPFGSAGLPEPDVMGEVFDRAPSGAEVAAGTARGAHRAETPAAAALRYHMASTDPQGLFTEEQRKSAIGRLTELMGTPVPTSKPGWGDIGLRLARAFVGGAENAGVQAFQGVGASLRENEAERKGRQMEPYNLGRQQMGDIAGLLGQDQQVRQSNHGMRAPDMVKLPTGEKIPANMVDDFLRAQQLADPRNVELGREKTRSEIDANRALAMYRGDKAEQGDRKLDIDQQRADDYSKRAAAYEAYVQKYGQPKNASEAEQLKFIASLLFANKTSATPTTMTPEEAADQLASLRGMLGGGGPQAPPSAFGDIPMPGLQQPPPSRAGKGPAP